MTSTLHEWIQTLRSVAPHEFSEIHIDVLSREYKNSSQWVQGTMNLLEEATNYFRHTPSRGIICATFALVGAENYLGVNYASCDDLSREFGLTPPSLYYFGEGAIPWHNPALTFRQANVSDFPADSRQ